MEVKISKWGNSQGIRLPLSILRQMGMTNPVGESVSIEVDSHGIAKMKKTKKAFNYADLFQDFDLQEYRQSYPSNLENRLDGQIGREAY